jgi:hypothetical protein
MTSDSLASQPAAIALSPRPELGLAGPTFQGWRAAR